MYTHIHVIIYRPTLRSDAPPSVRGRPPLPLPPDRLPTSRKRPIPTRVVNGVPNASHPQSRAHRTRSVNVSRKNSNVFRNVLFFPGAYPDIWGGRGSEYFLTTTSIHFNQRQLIFFYEYCVTVIIVALRKNHSMGTQKFAVIHRNRVGGRGG